MRSIFIADDGAKFDNEHDCRKYEDRLGIRVWIPAEVMLECIRQATPYQVSAKDRRILRERLTAIYEAQTPSSTTECCASTTVKNTEADR